LEKFIKRGRRNVFDSTLHNPDPDYQMRQNSVFAEYYSDPLKTRKDRNGLSYKKEEADMWNST
jgi:hypothetical protein